MTMAIEPVRKVLTKRQPRMGELSEGGGVLGHVQIIGPDGRVYLSKDIDFGATGAWEVFQNVKYILLTEYFSVPLDREFGMDYSMVDKPIPVAEAVLSQEVAVKIAMYEQRCLFTEIRYEGNGLAGKLNPNVQVTILSTEELGSLYPTGPYRPLVYTYIWPYPDPLLFLKQLGEISQDEGYLIRGLTMEQVQGIPDSIAGLLITGPQGNTGPPGPEGEKGDRGSNFYGGAGDPGWPSDAIVGDIYLNAETGDVFRLDPGGLTTRISR